MSCSSAVNVTVLDATHQLYAHVHHHYGLNDAFDRAVTLLLARQQAASSDAQQQGQQQQQGGASGVDSAAANGANAQQGTAAGQEAAKPEAAGSDTGAAAAAAATGGKGNAAGGRRAMLQAPAALRRRLQLSADAAIGAGRHTTPEQQRRLGLQESARRLLEGPPEVEHPCLHSGYRKAYRRRQQEGAAVPEPPEVLLVGR